MRRRRILLTLGGVFILVASSAVEAAAAKTFAASLNTFVCAHTGSANGLGTENVTGKATENGKNGTNYISIWGTFQQRVGSSWIKVYTYGPYTSAVFTNTVASHTHSQTFAWAFRGVDVGKTFRWKLKFVFFDKRSGPDLKLATKIRYSASCTA